MKNDNINWRVVIILLIMSIIGIIAVTPYSLTLQSDIIKDLPISQEILIFTSIIQSIIMFFALIVIGYYISKKIGLGTPILEKLSKGKKVINDIKKILPISAGLGASVGALIIILDLAFYYLSGPISSTAIETPSIFQGFLASFYGGINEEIMFRLFLMSVFILIINFIIKQKEGKTKKIVAWTAIIITAVVFGILHLPVTSAITEITPVIILRAIILNGVAGIVFGWLYWKKGLESSMISHFSADIVLHVLLPAILLIG